MIIERQLAQLIKSVSFNLDAKSLGIYKYVHMLEVDEMTLTVISFNMIYYIHHILVKLFWLKLERTVQERIIQHAESAIWYASYNVMIITT